mmetsp:Transcript_36431/g.104927  ORF Transcript_36431/g.104927 Transcript_36431/m.104927 type:complete len:108 (+) Transcript_36431:64-387(+)
MACNKKCPTTSSEPRCCPDKKFRKLGVQRASLDSRMLLRDGFLTKQHLPELPRSAGRAPCSYSSGDSFRTCCLAELPALAGVRTPMRIAATLDFFRILSSPSGQRWQ